MSDLHQQITTLGALEQAGLCRCPMRIPYLQPYSSGAWIPGVNSLQLQYYREAGSPEARRIFGPASFNCLLGPPGAQLPVEIGCDLSISQAPASFALPLQPHEAFNIPFRLTFRLAATQPFSIDVNAHASVISAQELAAVHLWKPPTPGTGNSMLVCAGVGTNMQLNLIGTLGDGRQLYSSTKELLFTSLQFTQPTNRQPIFLSFSIDLPQLGFSVYTIFMVPTVVCTPGIDAEYDFASQLLWRGSLPPRPETAPQWNFQDFCKRVVNGLKTSLDLERDLSHLDLLVLAHRAGFFLSNSAAPRAPTSAAGAMSETSVIWNGPQVCGGPTTKEEVDSMELYLRRTQALLKLIRPHYERLTPLIICGFSVGRQEAESLLEGQPPGTFLLRFSYEAGALALTFVTKDGSVDHQKMPLSNLHLVSLEEIVSLNENASYLLDTMTGTRHPREHVLARGYINDPKVEQLVRNSMGMAPALPAVSDAASTNPSMDSGSGGPERDAAAGDQLPDQGIMGPNVGGGTAVAAAMSQGQQQQMPAARQGAAVGAGNYSMMSGLPAMGNDGGLNSALEYLQAHGVDEAGQLYSNVNNNTIWE